MREFLTELKAKLIKKRIAIKGWQKREAKYLGPAEYQYLTDWEAISLSADWSEAEEITTFFRTKFKLPENAGPEYKFVFSFLTGGEASFYLNGEILQGLDRNHAQIIIDQTQYAGQEVELLIEAALDRINKIYVPDPDYKHAFSQAELQIIEREAEDFYYNLLALTELIEALQKRDEEQAEKLREIFNLLSAKYKNFQNDEINFKALNKIYQEQITSLAKLTESSSYQMACFGHAHIDVAWLWQFKETVRKAARSFSTAVNLMEAYPEFKFIQSQPQLYQYIKDYYPDLYKKIKTMVANKNWQVEGGMWVEADTNLLSGESLVRQFLYGKKFMQEEFETESKVLWLPDVFGYAGSLPQIMKKAEIDYFMTSKISWNDTNDFPYAIFNWQGIDGTEVLTHVPRVILPFTYNGEVYADKVLDVQDNYEKQKEENKFTYKFGDSSNYFKKDRVIPDDQLIYIYGYGDGGGGVTEPFINKIKRFNELAYLSKMNFSQPREYFMNLDEKIRDDELEFPSWRGELYLEYHRGTYTSQAKTKLNNRRSENIIREAEILNSLLDIDSQHKIEKVWQKMLTNQFHDIIPGSSIREVYQDVDQIYAEVQQELDNMIKTSFNFFSKNIALDIAEDSDYYLIWNGLAYQRDSVVQLEYKDKWQDKEISFYDYETQEQLLAEQSENLKGENLVKIYLNNLPALGYQVIEVKITEQKNVKIEQLKPKKPKLDDHTLVENDFYKLTFQGGKLLAIFSKKQEVELVAEDQLANQLQFFLDQPPRFDAWEIEADFADKEIKDELKLIKFQVSENELEKKISVQWQFRDSTFKQHIILYEELDRIDFKNLVDWREREILVKVAFPLNILTDQARFEIAYGNLLRSTTNNTDYEKAQFEVPAYRWADLSEPGLGVSILNDAKYGYDIKNNLLRLTLLKSSNYPDEKADYGLHEFTYSLYAHAGVFQQGATLEHSEDLNSPVLIAEINKEELSSDNAKQIHGSYPLSKSFAEVVKGNSRLEVIKKAEAGDGMVLRLYEPFGGKDQVQLKLADDIKFRQAKVVNLLENDLAGKVAWENNIISFAMKPFEIKTIKLF